MNRLLGCMVIFICFIVISGCNGAEEKEEFEIFGEDPVVLTHNLEHGMEAKLEGVLEYDHETKCLYIKSTSDFNEVRVPIWPKGTTAYTENDLHGVEIPDRGTILEGDMVEGGGGGVDASNLESDCVEEGITFAVTSIDL